MKDMAASLDRILEARETIKRFAESGGSCFIDGCSVLSDNDIIILAENMKELMERKERKGKERKGKERKGKERKGKERTKLPSMLYVCKACHKAHEYPVKICEYMSEDYFCNHKEFAKYRIVKEVNSDSPKR